MQDNGVSGEAVSERLVVAGEKEAGQFMYGSRIVDGVGVHLPTGLVFFGPGVDEADEVGPVRSAARADEKTVVGQQVVDR